ncbi:ADP-ribosylation factor GTPase-activating protein AGD3-like isoform X1 [Solanum pennellii]|uniref:ADP-ribosylation factor GTPase-activating protein AGD3-like isoform X1 n=1 Tax=Solanum pennellii TaxID=28526 RepID=A0ABM1GHF0_SOLPN|nr:ADP-ribosylation factor GTPase-activating protein AGD3-like isoform X1 [Solanum pennellii]
MQEGKTLFARIDDSPMFRQQIQSLEESSETLRDKCLKYYKGCRKYTEGLGEAYDKDIAFASSLEIFGGGRNDPISVAYGGPDMAKFATALREIGTYKEVLRSQVEHVLNDRLLHLATIDLPDVKEARKRFDKANVAYDQVREKFLSLRKSTRMDIAAAIEEELYNARLSFEQARFNLVGALSAVEAKKKYEFLEAVGSMMDSHLRFFKQGYEVLHQMEPYISQVLAYSQKARESSMYEQAALNERMQEYKKKIDQERRCSFNGSTNGDVTQPFSRSSHKLIEAVMQSASEGKVQTIKQGYLSKRSSNIRGDWKRRFFVLDSRGMLYYYRKQLSRPSFQGSASPLLSNRCSSPEPGSGLLSRWLSSHYHGGVHEEKAVARHTVNLLTSTIKADADQSDLRFCFRIISPTKNYTLQAESAAEQMDWIEKITGVITSLLTSQTPERHFSVSPISESSSIGSPIDHDQRAMEEYTSGRDLTGRSFMRPSKSSVHILSTKRERPVEALKRIPGNDKCADCGAPGPEWASLNLGLLICIECSGVHRNFGVHISKVRSLKLDVKVWGPSIITLFEALGNVFVNSVWEELLHARKTFQADEIPMRFFESDKHKEFFGKPSYADHISVKEKFIHAKYAEKRFIHKVKDTTRLLSVAEQLWEGVRANDKKAVYRLIVVYQADVNAVHGEEASPGSDSSSSFNPQSESEEHCIDEFLDGCSLLHLACQTADIGMVELLLQYGANINACDSRGQTPLHHSVMRGRTATSKLLLARGANPHIADLEGKTPCHLVSELALNDVEILALLKVANR